jgi:REP element-mobilizing transposase RayT
MKPEFNTNGFPLAYFITFRCFGTWLHGDARGSVDMLHRRYGAPFAPANKLRENYMRKLTKQPPVVLDNAQRVVVDRAIREAAAFRRWDIRALNVRTNHVHAVVSTSESRKDVLSVLKANATRELREHGLWTSEDSPWAERGSKRNLWDEQSLAEAIDYVLNHQ